MRKLTRVRRGEQGAVVVIVALFMCFVALGLAALTVDVGNINADRRQLQNGADAVALAVAGQCAATGTCVPNDPSLATLANANAADGATDIRRVDGQTPVCGSGTGLPVCSSASVPSMQNLQECPATVPAGNYVRVYTETTNTAGVHILPYAFGAAIAGAGSGANQQTCASAAWGSLGTYTATVPITISLCMFDKLVGGVSSLPPEPDAVKPGYGPGHVNAWPSPSPEQVEYTTKYAGTCLNSNGHTANGSFGWLNNTSCNSTVTSGSWVNGNPGNDVPTGCDLSQYWGTKILVPIFDCVVDSHSQPAAPPADPCFIPTSGGKNIWYHISGWASFYLSGYRFPGVSANSYPPALAPPCGPPDSCIGGWLTKLTLSAPPTGGGPNYGVTSVELVG
jgi:Flp pilus assembly protein TadG